VAQLTGVRVLARSDGDVTLVTADGLALPTSGAAPPFAVQGASLGAGSFHPGGGTPAVTLNGSDVTAQITGGRIGANLTLRDATLPGDQAQLDEFAQTLATRFDAQGLTLFTRPDGSVPSATGPLAQSGYVGFAAEITVNPSVAASPSQVRDGTHDVAGASPFTVNPSGGPAGSTTLVTRLLDYALGSRSSPGVAQPAPKVAGLGPSGTLSAPYAAPPDLASFAASLVGAQSQDSASAGDQLKQETDLQTSLTAKLSSRTGVSIDTELANLTSLQNAYGANAKVLSAVQALWTALLDAVAP
jgi:flagellar hook-associated protein 1 FlgK